MTMLCMKKAKDENNPVYKYIIKKEREGKAKKSIKYSRNKQIFKNVLFKSNGGKNKEELQKAA